MLKKLLILLSICFMAFTACKKQPAENTDNKTVVPTSTQVEQKADNVSVNETAAPAVNELITINVLEKQNDAQYITGDKAKFLAGSHIEMNTVAMVTMIVIKNSSMW